jgi:hypothetical protein
MKITPLTSAQMLSALIGKTEPVAIQTSIGVVHRRAFLSVAMKAEYDSRLIVNDAVGTPMVSAAGSELRKAYLCAVCLCDETGGALATEAHFKNAPSELVEELFGFCEEAYGLKLSAAEKKPK